jgi:hypothetical protein
MQEKRLSRWKSIDNLVNCTDSSDMNNSFSKWNAMRALAYDELDKAVLERFN